MKKLFLVVALSFFVLQGCGFDQEVLKSPTLKKSQKAASVSSLPSHFRATWYGTAYDGPYFKTQTIWLSGTLLKYTHFYPKNSWRCSGTLSVYSATPTQVMLQEHLDTSESFQGCITGGFIRLRVKSPKAVTYAHYAWVPRSTSPVLNEYIVKK